MNVPLHWPAVKRNPIMQWLSASLRSSVYVNVYAGILGDKETLEFASEGVFSWSNEFDSQSGKGGWNAGRESGGGGYGRASASARRNRKCTYRATARRAESDETRRVRGWRSEMLFGTNAPSVGPQLVAVAYSWNDFNVLILEASSLNYL